MAEFVSVHGTEFELAGVPIRFRGLDYGNWMLVEHHMIGLPWVEYKMRSTMREILGAEKSAAFWDTFMDTFLTREDIAFIAESGFNLIRLPFDYRHFGSDRTCNDYGRRGFEYFDRCIDLCRESGLYILLDLHAAPGCQARDWNAGSAFGESLFWDYPQFQQEALAVWRTIAARYVDEPVIMGYDVLCEPVAPDQQLFTKFNRDAIDAIRRVDTNHVIALESNFWGQQVATLETSLFDDPLVVPSIHFYPVAADQFDGQRGATADSSGTDNAHSSILKQLDGYYDYARIQRPVMAGEFGVNSWEETGDPQAAELFAATVDVFESLGFSWCMWDYKDLGRLGLVRPDESTAWVKFLDRADVAALRTTYLQKVEGFVEELAAAVPQLDKEDRLLLRTQTRHHWDALVLRHVVAIMNEYDEEQIAAMGGSFSFDQCRTFSDKLDLLKKFM